MVATLVTRHAVLERQIAEHPGVEIWAVYLDGHEAQAIVYPELTGRLVAGDRVLLNTTAVELALGTGGQHLVISPAEAIGGPVPPAAVTRDDGHILKLRYTPMQFRVLAVEEEASPHHEALRTTEHLPGTPVICLGLHSQLAPAICGIKEANPDLRVAYVMTDSAALPLANSQAVHHLRKANLLDVAVTAGQAFGGDLEAVNLYSGLLAAAVAGRADIIIAGQGPGNVGTGTPLGFGGVDQAMLLNATAALGGVPIAAPRISFADPRPRHHGVSRQTITALGQLTLAEVTIALPLLAPAQSDLLQRQLRETGLNRHRQLTRDGARGVTRCLQEGLFLRSMGRRYDDDPVFFQAAAAAGLAAIDLQ